MRGTRALLLSLCLAGWLRGAAFGIGIAYTVSPVPESGAWRTVFRIELSGVADMPTVRLQMPVWCPGDYEVQNHGRYVRDLRASATSGGDLPVVHPDANTWEIAPRGRNGLVVTYELPNVPPGNFTENAQVARDYAFYQGSACFLYVVGHKGDAATLRVHLPRGWHEALTPLESAKRPSRPDEPLFEAPDYDTLADSPLLVGQFVTGDFAASGASHVVALFGWTEREKVERYVDAIRPIVEEELRLMGGAPYRRYVFFIHLGGRGGALEHAASCRIAWSPRHAVSPEFQEFVAHEFFHLWNVKRARPAVLGPFDYVNPPHTHVLWFCEGVTDYFGVLTMRRAGVLTEEQYLATLSGYVAELQQMAARKRVTLEESSYRVWETRGSSGYGGLSYYLKGHLAGLCLDLKLRALTGGSASMDRVMRDLMRRYGSPKPGYPEDGIRSVLIDAAGEAMGRYYDRICRSTEELPFEECLADVGLQMTDGRIEADPAATAEAVRMRKDWLTGAAPAAAVTKRHPARRATAGRFGLATH